MFFFKVANRLKLGTYKRTGKNFSGKTCVFHRGGGNVKFYRLVDFYRRLNSFGVVCSILYDPNRSAYLGLVLYDNGFFSYIILANGVALGQRIFSGTTMSSKGFLTKGSSLNLSSIGLFGIISNVESRPYFGASIARAAGVGAMVVASTKEIITLKLKSGWIVSISPSAIASIGYVSNMSHNIRNIGKAGRNRNVGKRPVVRGVAMNPCDHPHGGGNGKSSPPATPLSPWNKITKWTPTTNTKIARLNRRLFRKLR